MLKFFLALNINKNEKLPVSNDRWARQKHWYNSDSVQVK